MKKMTIEMIDKTWKDVLLVSILLLGGGPLFFSYFIFKFLAGERLDFGGWIILLVVLLSLFIMPIILCVTRYRRNKIFDELQNQGKTEIFHIVDVEVYYKKIRRPGRGTETHGPYYRLIFENRLGELGHFTPMVRDQEYENLVLYLSAVKMGKTTRIPIEGYYWDGTYFILKQDLRYFLETQI